MIHKNPIIEFLLGLFYLSEKNASVKHDIREEVKKSSRITHNLLHRFVVVATLLTLLSSQSQAALKTWTAGGSGSWAVGANWSGGTVPAAGDDVVINPAGAVWTISNVPTISLNSISIGGSTNTILTGTGATTITINNIDATVAFNVNTGLSLTLGAGTAATAVNITFQTITTATTISGTLINTANNTLADNGNTITVQGNITNNGTHSGTGKIYFNGGVAVHVINGATSTFGNLELDDANGAAITGTGTTTISGNLTITQGTLTLNAFTTAFAVNGTTTIGNGVMAGGIVINSAAVTRTFTGLVTVGANGTWNNSSNATETFSGGITNSGTFTAGTGVQTFSTNSQSLTGTFTIPSVTVTGVTLTNNNSLTVNTALAGTGGLTQAANATLNIGFTGAPAITTLTANANGNTVDYNFAGAQTIKVPSSAYYNLITDISGTKTLAGATTANGNLTISAGTLADGGFVLQVLGNVVNNGTHSGTGKISLSGGAGVHAISGATSTFGNLELNDANGATITGTGTTTISGNLTITQGTLTLNAFTTAFAVNGTTTIGNGATAGGVFVNSAAVTRTFIGLVTIGANGTWNNASNATAVFRGGITNGGTFIAGTGVQTFNTNSQSLTGAFIIPSVTVTGVTLTNNNSLTINTALAGSGGLTQVVNATLNIGFNGVVGITTLTANANGNTITYNFAGAQTIKVSAGGYFNLITDISGTKTLAGATTVNGDLTVSAGTLADGGFALQVKGNVVNNGTHTGAGSITLTGGSATHNISGTGSFQNVVLNDANGATLASNTTLNGTLTLTAGVIHLGDYDLTITNTTPITGAPFDVTKMIETGGAGHLIRSGNVTNQSFNITYPVGSGGFYNPLVISSLPIIAAAVRSVSVRAVPTNLNILSNSINKYWDITATNITTQPATVLSYQFNAGEVVGSSLLFQPYTNSSGSWALATGPSVPGTNPSTSTGSATITGFWTVGAPGIFYSYQSGYWDLASTWTFDPGGTTGPGTTVPGQNDKVVILSGRTVSLEADNFTQNLDITINNGGFLDLTTWSFGSQLTALRGAGTIKLASSNFPSAVVNTLVTTDGGTTEYNYNGPMSALQATYYNLTINTIAGTSIQVSNLTLNGNLHVKQGTFQINDATPRRLDLIINGNVTVDNSGSIAIGTGVTRTSAGPMPSITGNTGSFLNYYELNSHRVQIYGNFTNNGIVRFSNLSNPVYNAFPANGFATVYFQGLSDNTIACNGATDFYNLVLDKGTDQTFKLIVSSSAYNNFRLFGANTSDGSVTLPASPAGNPNLKKALWIKNGTLDLQGLVVIPSLSEGNSAGAYESDFFIPSNGALILDGAGVIVLSTADDYTEVNAAYGLSGGSNAAYGINASGGFSGLSILGKLQINNGYLSTRESSGLLYWSYAPGQFILNGGTVDTKQFHNPEGGATGLISFVQNGGNLNVRGRFNNTINYTVPADLANPVMNTSRVTDGIDPAVGIGAFSVNSNVSNAFTMSGGNLSVYDVCNNTATPLAILINSPVSNINVTSGTVQIFPTTGTSLPDANYLINSTAVFNNLIVNRVSGAATVQLNTNPLVVLNNFTVPSGDFIANNLNVTVGGNFSLASGTTYITGTNTTFFNGNADQIFTINQAAPQMLNNLTINKTAGVALNLAGTQSLINVAGNFSLVLGTMNDNGKSINIAGNIFNSGIHAGTGKVSLNGTLTQTIDGNGIFGNLELNNTNGAAAPVSLLANITLNGLLTFSQDKLFNINTFNVKLNSTSAIVNGGPLRYIKSAGNAGDGGLTKVYSSPGTFNFPVGVINYTPGAIGLSAAPTAYGSITIIPVNYAHPNETTSGRSLSYFWRVKSLGFTLGGATVTHGYTYDQSNVVTGPGITEDGYVAARFNVSTNTWTRGTTADIDVTNNIIGQPGLGTFLKNVAFIDGDYTAGDDNPVNPFGTPTIYYSRINGAAAGSGLWSDVNTWSTDAVLQHSGAPAGSVPGASDIVIIGGQDSVYLATNNTVPNTDVRSCASLKIEKGSALDIGYNPASSFGLVLNSAIGNGNFRLTTSWTDQSTYAFPAGDFSDFNVNLGTTELYSTNPAPGTTYWLPNGVFTYGNLILSPLGGSNIIFPNNNLTIYGNLITRGQNADSWFCPTWNFNYPTPPGPIIAKTITVNGNLDIQGGSLIWYGNGGLAENFVVNGNVKVATLSALYVWSGATNQSMSIGGSLINNTDGLTHGLTTTSKVDFTGIPVTFFGSNSASISNTAGTPLTVFSTVTVNKGSSQATTLTVDIAGTLNTPADNWLTLQNGTLQYLRTNPSSDFTISTTTPFTIPTTSGFLVNLPSNTGNRNILVGNAANATGYLLLSGNLTLINGNVYIGPIASPASANDIEYTSSGASAINVQGGKLVVNGQIRRNPLNAGGILQYSQSGGTVTVNGQSSNATNAKFEVTNTGSNFTMSNGTLTIVRGNGATTTSSSPFGDLYIRPATGAATGGTIIFSQGGLAAPQNYFLDSNIPLYNLSITGTSAVNYATVRLLTSPLTLNGDMTINANSILNSNNIAVNFNGNLINTPGVGGYVYGTNLTTFSAANGSSYAGAQTITGATNFYNLVVNPGTSLTLSNPSTVNNNLTLSSGNFVLGGNAVTLLGNLENDASYTDNNAVGSGLVLIGTILQEITGTGAYSRITLNNAAGARVENNITLQEDLTMTAGILDIKKNLVTLGVNSNIQGAPFSAAKMITSDGVFSNVGLRKFFNPGATSFLYPIGTSGKYTPALLTITASNTVGYVRINNINSRHPAILDPSNALAYYWEVQSSGITGFSGNLVLNYLQGDVVGNEAGYLAARLLVPGTSWSETLGVNPAANTITFNYVTSNNLSGEYTAGTASAFPGNVPTYTSNADGNWTNPAIWTQTAGDPLPCPPGGPNGFIVIINNVVTLDANFCSAYRTTINDELKVTSAFYGHNLGSVDGNGTLYLENGSFPAGVFTTFLSCANNGTVEYGGSGTYTIIADLYDNIPNIVFSGTGSRILPNKDLTVCNQLIINGPVLDNSVYNKKLTIQGSMSRLAGSFNSGSGAGATVTFAGSGSQTIGGVLGDFTGVNAFNNFEINNSAGLRINDTGAIEVSGNLLLTNGLINTSSSRKLTITNSGINCVVPAGGSLNSFIDGPLTKKISQYDNFLFPIGIFIAGPGNILGNNIKLSSTQTGPILWSAEYKNPNGTSGSITAPLLGVSAQEYYNISTTAGSQSILNINWIPTSDVTPLITGGLSNIRLAHYNTGTSSWEQIPTSASGTNSNGTATSTGLVTYSNTDNFTLGSITDLKPRAKLAPVGPVCGAAGIPVSFTAPFSIPFNYTLSYTVDGTAQVPVTITSVPYTLPTPAPGVYKLTDFTYNNGASIGVVDASSISVYAVPTASNAGLDQTLCGITTAILTGNTPVVGTGLWSIVSGAGGTLIAPANPSSQFIGLNGVSYTLRWTISNGTCISSDDVNINFTILPDAPAASASQNFCGAHTVANLIATPPTGCTVDWYSAASGGVLLPGGTALVSGTTYYAESNGGGGCKSLTRTPVLVTINPIPLPGLVGPNLVCISSTGNVYTTESGKSNYLWSVVGGFISSGGLGTDNTATVTWNTSGPQTISVNYQDVGGCTAASPTVFNVTVAPNNTLLLTSAAGTDSQTRCINTAITNITYATTGATGATVTGLPAGVTGLWAANVVTISGTPTAAGPFTYTVTLTGGCGVITTTGTITVTANNTVARTSPVGTDAQTVCINTAITNITYTTTGANGATVTGLPAGVTGLWAANVVTISGTPTAAGPFTYTVTLTGGCGVITTTGTITVTANNTVARTSPVGTDAQMVCINTAITNITYATTGATGATVTGLPAGVTGLWAANVVTISGTPTAVGPFTYTVTLTGGCGIITTTGTITVTPDNTASLTSPVGTDAQTVCINTAITNITYTTTGATGATVIGLPAGVTGLWAANIVTISGTPTASGPFIYTVTLTGGCGVITTTGTITVTPDNTTSLTSPVGTDAQTVCINTAITNITYGTTGATGATVTGLPAGITGLWAANVVTISGTPTASGPFTYTVTLSGGCGVITTTGTLTVAATLPVSVVIAADANPVCAGTSVNFTATPTNGGTTPVYQWYNGATPVGTNSAIYSYIPANGDVITVILTSNVICQSGGPATSNAITIMVNPLPTVTTTQVNVACFGGTNGTATAIPAGGSGVYAYSWNTVPVQTTITATGLTAGTYIVTITDGNNCTATGSVTITEPATALSGSIVSQTNVSIPGGNDGSVVVSGSGGTPPYQYKLGSGVYQATGTFSSLSAGSYTVTVQDNNLCTFNVIVNITEPAATLSGSVASQINVACFGTSTGSVIVNGAGGVPPYEYTLNGGTYQVSDTFGSLAAGTYTITIRDAVLSTFNVSVTITQPASSVGGTITSQTNVLCFGSNTGSVTVAGSGGIPPYQYKLGAGSYQASGIFSTLAAGSYTGTVQDANLCTFDVSVTVTQPPIGLSGSIASQTNVSCSLSTDGSLTITGSGGILPYTYSLNGGTFQVSGTFNNLAGGNYTITVQDANLCTAAITATIIEPEAISIASTKVDASCPGVPDGSIALTITGGTQPYNVIWSDGILTQNRQDITGGTYSVVVTDKNGCAASLDIVVGIGGSEKCLVIPTIITPNNDGVNDTWQIKNIDLFPNAEVFIFTRWGKLVFHSKNLSANPWNGTYEGALLPTDSYHYVLHLNDGSKPRSGVISIIR